MENNNPINVGEFDVLYLCVSTKQNTINLYPLRMGIEQYQNYHLLILTSHKATKDHWTSRLVSALKDALTTNIIDISESESTTINLNEIESYIASNYKLHKKSILVVNYGGGLKQFTLPLLRIKDKRVKSKFHYVYPDKFTEKLLITEYITDAVVKAGVKYISPNENFEVRKPLELRCDLRTVLSLFTDKEISFQAIVDKNNISIVDSDLLAIIESLPDFYSNSEATDFLYNITGTNFEDNGENQLNILNKINIDRKYKNEVTQNIINDFNVNNKNSEFHIDSNFSLLYKGNIIHHLYPLPGLFRNSFWKYKNYITDEKTLNISTNLQSYFKECGLVLNNLVDNHLKIRPNALKNLFSLFSFVRGNDPFGHGKYFEYYCLLKLYQWSKLNSNIVSELLFNFQLTSTKKDNFQVEAVMYTTAGNIYFFECKTYEFKTKEFLAAYLNMSELGGVFNQYTVILPPLPSEENRVYRDKMTQIFTNLYDNIKGRVNAYICQTPGCTGKLQQIISLNERLDKIASDERKGLNEKSGSESIQ